MSNSEDYTDLQQELFSNKDSSAVVFADSRTDDLFFNETLTKHLPEDCVVYLDPATQIGRDTITTRLANGQPVGVLSYDPKHLAENYYEALDGLPVTQISNIDPITLKLYPHRIIVVPAMAATGQMFIDASAPDTLLDFGPTTIQARVTDAAQLAGIAVIVVDTPERGLVRYPDGSYARRFMVLGLEADAEMPRDDTEIETQTLEITDDNDN